MCLFRVACSPFFCGTMPSQIKKKEKMFKPIQKSAILSIGN